MDADENTTTTEEPTEQPTETKETETDPAQLLKENRRMEEIANKLLQDNEEMRKEMKAMKASTIKHSKAKIKQEEEEQSEADALRAKIKEYEERDAKREAEFLQSRKSLAVEAKLNELLPQLTDQPRLLKHLVRDRIGFAVEKGNDVTYVLDAEGKRTVDSWEKLIDEFRNDEGISRGIIQTKASGSNYTPEQKPKSTSDTSADKKWYDLKTKDGMEQHIRQLQAEGLEQVI